MNPAAQMQLTHGNFPDLNQMIGGTGYAVCGISFLVFSLWLARRWRGTIVGGGLVTVCALTAVWAGVVAWDIFDQALIAVRGILFEQVRNLAWTYFLVRLIAPKESVLRHATKNLRMTAAVAWILPVAGIFTVLANEYIAGAFGSRRVLDILATVAVIQAVALLVLVIAFFRAMGTQQRWGVRYLVIAVVALFGTDFFLYSKMLLQSPTDSTIWLARGFIACLIPPLLWGMARRNADWSVIGRVSLNTAFSATTFILAVIYVGALLALGRFAEGIGGDSGRLIRDILFGIGFLLLTILLVSGAIRARLRVFLSKHFFDYKYDYRDEWLRLIATLATSETEMGIAERSIRALANLMDCNAGMLWQVQPNGHFAPTFALNMPDIPGSNEPTCSNMSEFLRDWQWVINLHEIPVAPEMYQGLILPAWMAKIEDAWLVVPLLQQDSLTGFAVLAQPRNQPHFNWEDIDLLKTAGRQVAIHLAEARAAQGWAEARQFEAYHRLSAYVVHDLKNLIAQLSLVVSNAKKHAHNPQFILDAAATVENAIDRMNRLQAQLRTPVQLESVDQVSIISLSEMLSEIRLATSLQRPAPTFENVDNSLRVRGYVERLSTAIQHLVKNAQDATPEDGSVEITLTREGVNALIIICDTGKGMDEVFVREKLFTPFVTTKGLTGMGIGAYEAREVIFALGGTLKVTSSPGKGTRFEIRLPLVVPE